jgi:hypothetical protein
MYKDHLTLAAPCNGTMPCRRSCRAAPKEQRMPNDKGKGTGEPGWTGEEKGQGAPTSGDADAAGAAGEAGYGGDDRAATEAAAAQVENDTESETSPKDREQ